MTRKKYSDDEEFLMDAEFDRLVTTIQREIERALQEGFALRNDPRIAYSISVERNSPRKKARKAIKKDDASLQDIFCEIIEQKDRVVLLVQFGFDPVDFDLSFDSGKEQLVLRVKSAEQSYKKYISFPYSVSFKKKQSTYKNNILELVFLKKK